MSVLVVGTVAFDAIETPFQKTDRIIGGSATYIGLAASYFTDGINMVSVVGDDFPAETLRAFNERGMDTRGIQVIEGQKSFFWSGKYHLDMNTRDTLVTDLNVLADFNPVIPEMYRTSEFLMLGNIDPTLQLKVIKQMAKRPKLIVMDTMNYWMDATPEPLNEVLKHVDVLVINDEEARQLGQDYGIVKSARKILEMGPKFLIVKKGEHGALLFYDSHVFFAPALPLEEVFDPTGAGDTFAGGFIGHLARTRDLGFDNMKRAVIYGSAMASFCVEKFGPNRILDLPEAELEERVREFVNLTQFDIELVG
jgi:sugar/nucleoside kinase (ribokinase family)